ncbi:hypothetical protein IIC38_15970 [candidate division KSB1 bacterium]|nr:hypothetical protein [candidate division KSB1 bacterium]
MKNNLLEKAKESMEIKQVLDRNKKEDNHDLEVFKKNIINLVKAKPGTAVLTLKHWLQQ